MAVGKIITWKKRVRGSNIIFPLIFRLLGRISGGEKEKGTDISGKKSRFKERGMGKNIKL